MSKQKRGGGADFGNNVRVEVDGAGDRAAFGAAFLPAAVDRKLPGINLSESTDERQPVPLGGGRRRFPAAFAGPAADAYGTVWSRYASAAFVQHGGLSVPVPCLHRQ